MTTDVKKSCPICANVDKNILLASRKNIPTLQNVTLSSREEAIGFPTGKLTMLRCANCSFVWNADFEQDKISYDDGYNNDVTFSNYYVSHLEKMADRIIQSVPAGEDIHYVEIGCGEADFLRLVVERAKGRCVSAIGFDPSFTGEEKLPKGAVVHKTFFGPDQVKLVPDATNVVCSRHTIEHVPDVHGFVSALAAPMTTHSRTLFVETPDANWILENTAFQDLFYEHCSIYTPESMSKILGEYGLSAKTTAVYGGQYMWTEANLFADKLALKSDNFHGKASQDLAKTYVDESERMLNDWSTFIQSHSKKGPVAIWGAASKGVTFTLSMSQIQDAQSGISCAIDLNEAKQKCFMPITSTPIVSPEDAKKLGVATVIIMNPNYLDEIKIMAADLDWSPEFATLND
jgi:hypothetical protein